MFTPATDGRCQRNAMNMLPIGVIMGPFKYPGVRVGGKWLTNSDCNFIIERITDKLAENGRRCLKPSTWFCFDMFSLVPLCCFIRNY